MCGCCRVCQRDRINFCHSINFDAIIKNDERYIDVWQRWRPLICAPISFQWKFTGCFVSLKTEKCTVRIYRLPGCLSPPPALGCHSHAKSNTKYLPNTINNFQRFNAQSFYGIKFTDWNLDNDIPCTHTHSVLYTPRTVCIIMKSSYFFPINTLGFRQRVRFWFLYQKIDAESVTITVIKSLFTFNLIAMCFINHTNANRTDFDLISLLRDIANHYIDCNGLFVKRKKRFWPMIYAIGSQMGSNEFRQYLHNDLFINLLLKTCKSQDSSIVFFVNTKDHTTNGMKNTRELSKQTTMILEIV